MRTNEIIKITGYFEPQTQMVWVMDYDPETSYPSEEHIRVIHFSFLDRKEAEAKP